MKVKIVKLASGYNTNELPGQIFKTKAALIKGLKTKTARWDEEYDDYDEDRSEFADPHGESALRAESPSNPRDQACPTCGAQNVLTRKDKQLGYQCDNCADAAEGRFGKAKGKQKKAQLANFSSEEEQLAELAQSRGPDVLVSILESSGGTVPDKVQELAVSKDPEDLNYLLAYITPCENAQAIAVSKDPEAIKWLLEAGIKPTKRIKDIAISTHGDVARQYLSKIK